MWILVIFCMIIMIGIWKINLDSNKSTKINSPNFNNLAVPSFPKLEEKLGELNEGVGNMEKTDEEEPPEENKEEVEEDRAEEKLEKIQ